MQLLIEGIVPLLSLLLNLKAVDLKVSPEWRGILPHGTDIKGMSGEEAG